MSGRGERIVHLSDLDNKFACVTCDMIVCCWKKSSRLVCYWPKLSCHKYSILNFWKRVQFLGETSECEYPSFVQLLKITEGKLEISLALCWKTVTKKELDFPCFFRRKKVESKKVLTCFEKEVWKISGKLRN